MEQYMNGEPSVSSKSRHGPVEADSPTRIVKCELREDVLRDDNVLEIDFVSTHPALAEFEGKNLLLHSPGQLVLSEEYGFAFVPERGNGTFPLTGAISIQEAVRDGLIVVLPE